MGKRLSNPQIEEALASLPGFRLEASALVREWQFADFASAIRFVQEVADCAERLDHHPDIDIRFTRVRLALWTHTAGGVTTRDLDLARCLDAIL